MSCFELSLPQKKTRVEDVFVKLSYNIEVPKRYKRLCHSSSGLVLKNLSNEPV